MKRREMGQTAWERGLLSVEAFFFIPAWTRDANCSLALLPSNYLLHCAHPFLPGDGSSCFASAPTQPGPVPTAPRPSWQPPSAAAPAHSASCLQRWERNISVPFPSLLLLLLLLLLRWGGAAALGRRQRPLRKLPRAAVAGRQGQRAAARRADGPAGGLRQRLRGLRPRALGALGCRRDHHAGRRRRAPARRGRGPLSQSSAPPGPLLRDCAVESATPRARLASPDHPRAPTCDPPPSRRVLRAPNCSRPRGCLRVLVAVGGGVPEPGSCGLGRLPALCRGAAPQWRSSLLRLRHLFARWVTFGGPTKFGAPFMHKTDLHVALRVRVTRNLAGLQGGGQRGLGVEAEANSFVSPFPALPSPNSYHRHASSNKWVFFVSRDSFV